MEEKEKEEIKEIIEEKLEEKNKEIKKEKKAIVISSIICTILLILGVTIFVLYIRKPQYKIKVNSGGGTITRDIVLKDNTIKELPQINPPEGKVLVTWINKKNEAVRPNLQLTGNDTITPVFEEENRETITLRFVSGTDEIVPDIVITKGTKIILPAKLNKYSDWTFLYWVDSNGFIIQEGARAYEDMTIYAYWKKASSPKEEVTIKFDTGTDEKIGDIKLPKGSKYVFITPKKKNGNKVFKGWLDDNGNLLDNSSVVEKNITLKAEWKEPYSCPSDCTPSENGKTCTKETVTEPSKQMVCPGKEYYGKCIDTSKYECGRQCSSGYPFGDDEMDYEINGEACCVKKIDRVEQFSCPEGYNREGEQCKKTEIINCEAN